MGQSEHHSHSHVHDPKEKKRQINRLSRVIGHLEYVKKMIENDEDCAAVLMQISATKSALNGLGKEIINACRLFSGLPVPEMLRSLFLRLLSHFLTPHFIFLIRRKFSCVYECNPIGLHPFSVFNLSHNFFSFDCLWQMYI